MLFDAIKFSGYKSFPADKYAEIQRLEYVNLFIGKNNCGKSSVLDVIGSACQISYRNQLPQTPAMMLAGYRINEESIRDSVDNVIPRLDYRAKNSMLKHVGHILWLQLEAHGFTSGAWYTQAYDPHLNESIQEDRADWKRYSQRGVDSPPTQTRFAKISAERNILPERASEKPQLLPDGAGATNVIRSIINNKNYDEQLIEVTLLDALNKIMGNDAQFSSIRIQEVRIGKEAGDTVWEVFLQEKGSPRFPLSQSGSGLKTIILVLLNLLVLPVIENKQEFFFAFEELENNLHPALQRRLFDFIYDYAVTNKTYIFLTTHSHVAINMFFGKEHTALYHVIKEGHASEIKTIENYLDKVEILDDLDVKASDLLQANGIIWVEGPSDRVYIKRWLEVFGGDDIQEGRDYQFAYYGGRLLSHYSAEEDAQDLINILLINRNSAIVMDSDKHSQSASINETKKRVAKEFADKHLFSWITKGKEIENYLSFEAINAAFSCKLQAQCLKYGLFPEYIETVYKGFPSKKVEFANRVKGCIDATPILDLDVQIKKLYQAIKSWNQ